MDSALFKDLVIMRAEAWFSETRLECPYYRAGGMCSFGCWEEPVCYTEEPSGGWLARAFEAWMDIAGTCRAAATEERGHHGAVKHLRDCAREADRHAVRVLREWL